MVGYRGVWYFKSEKIMEKKDVKIQLYMKAPVSRRKTPISR